MLKNNKQLSFGMMEDNLMLKGKDFLDKINEIIDFTLIEEKLNQLYNPHKGRPAIPPLILFKVILLEQWYGLSDVAAVKAIHDNRRFERFVGQEVRYYHVDDTTLVKFRKRIGNEGALEEMLRIIIQQLRDKGYIRRDGTIIDATHVEGATKAGRRRKNGELVDPDVAKTLCRGRVREGMKVHVAMDVGSLLIEAVKLTNIRLHDSNVFEELLPADTKAVYTDRAYDSESKHNYLAENGKEDGILRQSRRNKPLTELEKALNSLFSKTRTSIEAKLSDLKRWCHLGKLRYFKKESNWIQVIFAVIASNLKRCVVLAGC